jgi:hypothetical protein
MSDSTLTVRAASPRDEATLARLSHPRPRPGGPVLIAEQDGVPVATLALTSGSIDADRSRVTAAATRLLRLRRYELMRQGGEVGEASALLRRRRAPVTA